MRINNKNLNKIKIHEIEKKNAHNYFNMKINKLS